MSIPPVLKNISAKDLFLIDGLGAMLSAILLGLVLPQFESVFGMPRQVLYLLAIGPCIFAAYDWICYFSSLKKPGLYLKGIAFANLLYCFLSIFFLYRHQEVLSSLGWLYFLLELLVVAALVGIEFNKSRAL